MNDYRYIGSLRTSGGKAIINDLCGIIAASPSFVVASGLWEGALIDGASRLQILTRIILPLAVPGLISALIFSFTLCWAVRLPARSRL